ncbi:MAG TPA: 5-methyltetrahydropteroyltriglutamate--homocysteine S-methyltransferase [Xanthobacteraceae bacterium]|nr:5-methyltetrahydropteroyltriglutamate--homocysteine S-methyltransferase [Xanthobacteraceae bacterium]
MLSRANPPFRAEHIGSLLRPPALLDLRGRFARGQASRDELAAAEDRAITEALALQERVGLKVATDGEFRRRSYHSFFYSQLGDITIDVAGAASGQAGTRADQPASLINSRVTWTNPINVADFKFIEANTRLVPKITIPGPCALHYRGGDAAVLASAYKDVDQFWDDIVVAFGKELTALARAGCRYIQIDETAFAKFGDPEVQAALAARGDDWNALIDKYIAVTNRILGEAPTELRVGMHLCRGNRGGRWHAEGSYDVIADRLFNALDVKFYFLEYDSPRAGTFSPLRFTPPHKSVVLGIVTTKTSSVESKADLTRRLDEATKYLSLDQLAISPQCGFASTVAGNPVSETDQRAKLALCVDVARAAWG